MDKALGKKGAILILIILLSSFAFQTRNAEASTQISIVASADSYVDTLDPNANHGNSIFLYAHNYTESVGEAGAGADDAENMVGPIGDTWLKFDLSQIPSQATVDSVILRLHTAVWGTRTVNMVGVYIGNDNSWTESSITWNNAPSPSSTIPLQVVECGDPDIDREFNITDALAGKTAVSLVLKTVQLAKEPAVFNSRDLSDGPTLVVDYTLPLDTGLIVVAAIGAVVIVAVLGTFIVKLKQKKKQDVP
jgi:hypothetical protein